jgi:hypothetical protein
MVCVHAGPSDEAAHHRGQRLTVRPDPLSPARLGLVPDETTDPRPHRRAGDRSARRPRFVLPDDHHDERARERIEAFLEGPPRIRRSRLRSRPIDRHRRPPKRPVPLDTRPDWNAALHRDDARVARYGRPAAVLIVDILGPGSIRIDQVASDVGWRIRHQVRETDRVARVTAGRFHILLPETDEPEAIALGERIRRACADVGVGPGGLTVSIRTAAGGPVHGGTLLDALQSAEERLAG